MRGRIRRAARTGWATLRIGWSIAAASGGCASIGVVRTAAAQAGGTAAPVWVADVTITRDEFGVPYIDAKTVTAAFSGLAYAMAEDGYRELEDSYARALGMASAYYGESRVAADELRLRVRAVETSRQQYAAEPADAVHAYQAFADGLNYFMRMHPEIPPRHITRYDGWMILAFANDLGVVQPMENALLNRTLPGTHRTTTQDDALARIVRTAEGRPLMLSSFSGTQPYEMNLHTADGWRFHGYGTLGSAIPGTGYSASIAFATIAPDAVGAVHAVATGSHVTSRTDSLRVNTSAGVMTRRLEISQADAGVVVATAGDTMFVVPTATGPLRSEWTRWHAMAHARDAASFASASAASPDNSQPGSKTLFVDASGSASVSEGGSMHGDSSTGGVAIGMRANLAAASSTAAPAATTWTLQSLARSAFDTRVRTADAEIAALVDEWEQVGARNPERALAMDSAVTILRTWDRVSTLESQAMTLYAAYFNEFSGNTSPLSRFTALERVVLDRRRFPPQPWGSVNALRRSGKTAVPVAGAPAHLGIMFAYDASSGRESVVWAVDPATGAASSVRSFGQAADPASVHSFDQAVLFAAGSLKAASVHGPVTGAGIPAAPYHPGETTGRSP